MVDFHRHLGFFYTMWSFTVNQATGLYLQPQCQTWCLYVQQWPSYGQKCTMWFSIWRPPPSWFLHKGFKFGTCDHRDCPNMNPWTFFEKGTWPGSRDTLTFGSLGDNTFKILQQNLCEFEQSAVRESRLYSTLTNGGYTDNVFYTSWAYKECHNINIL